MNDDRKGVIDLFGGPGAFHIGQEEKKELLDVINSGYLVRYGSSDNPLFQHKVDLLEKEFCNYTNVKYALALSSGTAALICCLAALEIGPGDEVLVPGYTFVATISACIECRAIPVLVEIDKSLNMDVTDLKEKITDKTKAIIAVHMLGNPCDMEAIMNIAKEKKLKVIEDCCQAGGARYKGKSVGTYGDMAAFSLNWYKSITSGDGGMLITNDEQLYRRSFAFHDQGHSPLRMDVEIGRRSILGLNFRMNEITGAVALAQLRKLDKIISKLRKNKELLKGFLTGLPSITFRTIHDTDECATLLTIIFEKKEMAEAFCSKIGSKPIAESGWHVYKNMEHLLDMRVSNNKGCPFTCPFYGKEVNYKNTKLPKTDDILERAVNISIGVVDEGIGSAFGIHPNSEEDEIVAVGKKIREIILDLNDARTLLCE